MDIIPGRLPDDSILNSTDKDMQMRVCEEGEFGKQFWGVERKL